MEINQNALNEAGWAFVEAAPAGYLTNVLFNHLKPTLQKAIECYIEKSGEEKDWKEVYSAGFMAAEALHGNLSQRVRAIQADRATKLENIEDDAEFTTLCLALMSSKALAEHKEAIANYFRKQLK
jgi:hypothetical protein